MIQERPITKRSNLIKRRYFTADLTEDFEGGLKRDDWMAIKASAVYRARQDNPNLLNKKYTWKLIWVRGDLVRLSYSWR